MKQTALIDTHLSLGAKMTEFAGWEMPLRYSSIFKEHLAVREKAGIFDVSHMGDFFIRGSGAAEFLANLLPTDFSKIEPGKEKYSHILNSDGIILDDTITMRLSKNEYLMVPNAANRKKIFKHVSQHLPDDVELIDRTEDIPCIALQGPLSMKILSKLTDYDLSRIGFFDFDDVPVRGKDGKKHTVRVSCSGYTGELGYELHTTNNFAREFWDLLTEAGKEFGMIPCGLGARDTLRLEKGFLLSGTDFNNNKTSLETGHDWIIDWNHDFIGKESLIRQKNNGGFRTFTALVMQERGIPRKGMDIFSNGKKIGGVTSGTMSPSLRKGIALGFVEPDHKENEGLVGIEIRGKIKKARIKKPPLVTS